MTDQPLAGAPLDTTPWSRVGPRTFFAAAGGVGLLWQVILVALAYQHAESLRAMLQTAGIEPGAATRLFFATYRFWPVVVALSAVAVFAPLRRAATSPRALALIAAVPLLIGMLLQTWLNEAATAPLYQIIERLG